MGVTVPVDATTILAALTTDSVKYAGSNIQYGNVKFLFLWDVNNDEFKAKAGTWAQSNSAVQWMGQHLNNTSHAQNDEASFGLFYVPTSGTYTIYILGAQLSSSGKLHFLINGVDVGNIDQYDAAGVNNSIQSVSAGTLTAGVKALTIKISDKNAASSDYNAYIQSVMLVKT